MNNNDRIKVYITCCSKDLYLLNCCVASIRYWNETIPVFLLKEMSQGTFDTSELESRFNVSSLPLQCDKVQGYIKLQPHFEPTGGRILLMDADIVWLGNLEEMLAEVQEDILFDAYSPEDYPNELNKWYFAYPRVLQHYPDYIYPGFLFNCGIYFFRSGIFSPGDFEGIIKWKNNTKPEVEDLFYCEDQGIINFLVARKIAGNLINTRTSKLQLWGWGDEAMNYPLENIINRKGQQLVIHWFGDKNGLRSFMPAERILSFYEDFYYSKLGNGTIKKNKDRLMRTFSHFHTYTYNLVKGWYKKLFKG